MQLKFQSRDKIYICENTKRLWKTLPSDGQPALSVHQRQVEPKAALNCCCLYSQWHMLLNLTHWTFNGLTADDIFKESSTQ